MAVPTIDVGFLVGKVPGVEDAVVVAQVLEGGMGVDTGETAVEHGNADALAV